LLSIGKLATGPGTGRYYVDQVACGAEDYYGDEGEAPGQWLGSGTDDLGLSGEVRETQIIQVLELRDPTSGEPLRRPPTTGAVAGFDLTLRSPKSVSVLFGIADEKTASELRAAHAVAVEQSLRYLERSACRVRRGAAGAVSLTGGGFIAAGFEHRSSRAGDPLLHTHVVIANAARGPDGRWSALDGRALYREAKTGGYLYQAALRREITERLGLEWNEPENGVADLTAVPRSVIEHFSQRRAEILEHMAGRGERSARAAQIATLETRRAKRHDVPIGRLREEWRSRAGEHGLIGFRLDRALRRIRRPPRRLDVERLALTLESAQGLTRGRSTFARRDVLQAFAEAARDGATVAQAEAFAKAFLGRGTIVELAPISGERRFSTRELLRTERRALDLAMRRRLASTAIAERPAVDAAITERPTLSPEQRELVVALTRLGRGVEVARAPAGAGKTFALDAAREAWRASGVPVLGCALSARAAAELRDQAGVDATTIARLVHAFEGGATLAPRSVLLIDEAAMVGTRDLYRLAQAVAAADGKLVLVGDDRQLPEIETGGLFAAIADRVGTLELREVRRQRDEWDRDALVALRAGDVEHFAREYEAHGRIVASPSAEASRERMVEDWLQARSAGEQAVMLAHRRRDVADLNQRARQQLRALGRLGADELLTETAAFAVGDLVVARRNDRRLGIVNGDVGRLVAISDDQLAVALESGRRVDLPGAYARGGQLQNGYAFTAHLAQGSTVDRAFVLGSDELYREWGYTALSRHRTEARFYVSSTPEFLNRAAEPLDADGDVSAAVAGALRGSRAQQLALDGVDPDPSQTTLEHNLRDARQRLAEIEVRVGEVSEERAGIPWHQRARRRELDRFVASCERPRDATQREVDRVRRELASQPAIERPRLSRATDPLAQLDRGSERVRARELERDSGLGRGL
jgi:conjugative relaxase-like TrwC/TraI family protein